MVARAGHGERLTPADEVRSVLSSCEQALGNLSGSGERALAVLRGLDRLHDLLPELEARGMDLRPERTRLSNLEGELRRRAAEIERELRTTGGLAAGRLDVTDDHSRWWWYLDEQRGQERRRTARGALLAAGVGLAALLVLSVVYQRFLAPDPLTVRAQELRSHAEMLAQAGDYAAALAKLDEAQELVPTDGELCVWRVALTTLIGEPAKAAELFDAALPLFDDESVFLIARAQTYLQLKDLDRAGADAELALESDPASPQALLVQASVLEAKGSDGLAVAALEAASRNADERGMHELSAVARFRMALLLQRGGMPQMAP